MAALFHTFLICVNPDDVNWCSIRLTPSSCQGPRYIRTFFYTCYYYYDIRDHKPSATKYVNNFYNLLMYILLNYYALWYKNNLFKYIERFSYSQKLMTELIMACRSDQTLFGKNTLFHYQKNKIKNIYHIKHQLLKHRIREI